MATNTETIVDIDCDESIPLLQGRHRNAYNAEVTESYLQELHRTECEFKINLDQVDLIQKYVESFVETLIQRVVVSINIEDAYTETRFLKVGSYYDRTKNAYPDEFDFIYVLKECSSTDDERQERQLMKVADEFHKRLKGFVKNRDVPGVSCEYICLHGPASKVALHIPTSVNAELDIVSIDISVAYRCRLQNSFWIDLQICFEDWLCIIGNTGSFLKMPIYLNHPKRRTFVAWTVTESEKRYMLTFMSEKHKKVYRLLKFLINGNDGNEQVRHFVRKLSNSDTWIVKKMHERHVDSQIVFDFPSYAIKCLVFWHEQCCQNDTNRVSDCILQVLGQILKRFKNELDTDLQRGFCMFSIYNELVVRVEKVFEGSIEVADEFEVATDIADVVSDMINGLRTGSESGHENSQTTILSTRTVGHVKNVLQKHKASLLLKILYYIYFVTGCIIACVIGLGFISVIVLNSLGYLQTNDTGAPHSNLSDFDFGLHSIECVLSKHTNSYSFPCETYYCIPEHLYSDLDEIKNKFSLSCDTTSTSVAFLNDSRNICDVFICTSRFTTKNSTRLSHTAGEVNRCCLLTEKNKSSSLPGNIVLSVLYVFIGSFVLMGVIRCIPSIKNRWKQRQRYREIRPKIVATLIALEEQGLTFY